MSDATTSELLFRPVDELAGMVRAGEVSSRELVQASLDRIDEVGERVNAFVDVFADEALAAADEIPAGDDRPLAGVPIAIKNNTPVAGKRLTFASSFMGDFAAPFDANLVRRFREAGAIIVGTTTLPEWGIQPATETRRFGATRNPWDLSRTPGGSSGGSAAAVAAGWCRSRTPTTAAGRRGSPPRAAAWSASRASAAACRWPRRSASSSWAARAW
jgi:amidase